MGGVFSSKCCLAPLNNSARAEDEDKEGLERREVTRDEVEAVDGEWEVLEVIEAAAATAAALLSCRREWEIKARFTLGAKGRVEGVGPTEVPADKPAVPLASTSLPHVSSSGLFFGLFCTTLTSPALPPPFPKSDLQLAPSATPNREGGSSESESSGFCSRWRRKCTLRLPRVVKRLRHTGHW